MGISNVVDQPTALALKEKGWVKETFIIHVLAWGNWFIRRSDEVKFRDSVDWLPAPNVTEIGEELKWSYYYQYWWRATDAIIPLAEWLYSIMHDANELAKVWIWAKEVKP